MLERDSSWESKVISDAFYKTLAKHCVRIADACVEELKNRLHSYIEYEEK